MSESLFAARAWVEHYDAPSGDPAGVGPRYGTLAEQAQIARDYIALRESVEASGWFKCSRCNGRGTKQCNCGDRQVCLPWCGDPCDKCRGTGLDPERATLVDGGAA